MFEGLSEKLAGAFGKFKNKGKLTEKDVREGMSKPEFINYVEL